MRFEHLLPVNHPEPLGPPESHEPQLTRWGVWRGLWQRVERPELFLPGLTGVKILSRAENLITRELSFGAARVLDEVTFEAGEWLCFTTRLDAADVGRAGGSLTISLEGGEGKDGESEGEEGDKGKGEDKSEAMPLSLRFVYDTTFDELGENAPYAAYLKEVYRDSDEETLAVIRRLLAEEEKRGGGYFCPGAMSGDGGKHR